MEKGWRYTAFAGFTRIATGDLATVLTGMWEAREGEDQVLVFDDETGKQVDFNLHGTLEEVLARALPPEPKKGPGRPRLGVVSREVSLLPRHWEWLERQPQTASGTLRRLVDAARKNVPAEDRTKERLEAAGKFMWSMTGNLEGFEESSRALYARNWAVFDRLIASWPEDVRNHLSMMVQAVTDDHSASRPGSSAGASAPSSPTPNRL